MRPGNREDVEGGTEVVVKKSPRQREVMRTGMGLINVLARRCSVMRPGSSDDEDGAGRWNADRAGGLDQRVGKALQRDAPQAPIDDDRAGRLEADRTGR